MTRKMKDLVQIQGGFKPSVQLPGDFFNDDLNRHFVSTYIPTQETLDIFMSIRDSLQPGSEQRAHLFSGTYGTGKSDLMLMIANYVTRDPDDPLLQPFFERLRRLNDAKAEAIAQARLGRPPLLLVLLQADTAITFSSFVLDGLAKTLENAQLAYLMGRTYYHAALELIQSWEWEHPENCQLLSGVLERDYGIPLDGLKRDLAGIRADSALEVFRPAVQKAIGMPFHPTAVIQRPSDAFDEVVARLVDSGQYSGLFVICDEFTHLLQRLAESPTAADSKAIDNLAERAVRSGQRQIHFVVVSLQSFASALGSTQLSQKSLERSGGRFTQRELKSQNVEELICASIAKLVSADQLFQGAPSQQDDLLELAMKLWGQREERRRDREWNLQTIVRGAFPLHPLATYCLPRLNATLAQNERTMFSFLWDKEHGLNGFIHNNSAEPSSTGWLPVMSLADLFAYFEPNLKEKRPDLTLTYNEARKNLGAERLASGLADSVLRALVLLEVVSDPNLRADRALLRHAAALPPGDETQLDDALSQLEQALVAYKDQAERYRLVLPGRANPLELKRLIEQRAREMPGSPLELLNSLHGPEPIKAETYNRERGTSRQLAARFISPNGLTSPATLATDLQEQDGLVWYVIAASEQELKTARAEALQITRGNDQVVVAVPRQPTELITRFQRKRALEAIRSGTEYQSPDFQDLLRDTGLVGRDYIEAFEQARRYFDKPGNFEWYRKGRTVDVGIPQHLDGLATTTMKEIFPKTPPHHTAQHLKPSGTSKNLRDAVDCLLQAPFKLPVKKGKSAKDAILRDGADNLGLIVQTGKIKGYEEFDVVMPDKATPLSHEVWLLIDDRLQKGDAWQLVLETLVARPYGLYPSVLQLFIAAFYRYNRDFLEVHELGKAELKPIDLTGEMVEKLVQSPDRYLIRYQPLSELQRKCLRGLAERALYPGRQLPSLRGAAASLRNRVAEALRLWVEQMPGVPMVARRATADELQSVLSDCSTETIQAAIALLQVAQQADVPATAIALLEKLPGEIGLPPDSQIWADDQVDKALALLESACAALQKFPKSFKAHMAWQVGQLFGLQTPPVNWDDALRAALSWRKLSASGVRLNDLSGSHDARDLIHVLDDEPHNFEQAFLNTLPNRMGLHLLEQWTSMSVKDEYLRRLREAKAQVEQVAAEIAQRRPPPPTPKPVMPVRPPGPSLPGVTPPGLPGISPPSVTPTPPASGPMVVGKPVETPEPPAGTDAVIPPSPVADYPAVEEAFIQAQSIFDKLNPSERRVLLRKLRQRYDPS